MMVEDLGVQAKEASAHEVVKLLSLTEHLQSIASIKAHYVTRQQTFIIEKQHQRRNNSADEELRMDFFNEYKSVPKVENIKRDLVSNLKEFASAD